MGGDAAGGDLPTALFEGGMTPAVAAAAAVHAGAATLGGEALALPEEGSLFGTPSLYVPIGGGLSGGRVGDCGNC